MKKPNSTYEFSKKFAIVILIFSCLVTIFSCYMMYKTEDISSLPVIITAVFTELATSTGFYYSKAKAENQLKIKNQLIFNTLKMEKAFDEDDIAEAERLIEKAEQQIDIEDDNISV